MTNWLWACTEVTEPQLVSVSTQSGGKTGIGTLKFYLGTCTYTKPASRRRQFSKWNVRTCIVSPALSWIPKEKQLTHSGFSKEQTSSFLVFVCSALIACFPIKQHQSLGTAGPATGRTVNSLCQVQSQMVLTLSWRVQRRSIKQQHLFTTLDGQTIRTKCVQTHPSSISRGGSHPGVRCTPDPFQGGTHFYTCLFSEHQIDQGCTVCAFHSHTRLEIYCSSNAGLLFCSSHFFV